MKHTLVIDDSTSIGKHLLGIIKSIKTSTKAVTFISEGQAEENAIALMIDKGLKTGLANKNSVLKKLKLK